MCKRFSLFILISILLLCILYKYSGSPDSKESFAYPIQAPLPSGGLLVDNDWSFKDTNDLLTPLSSDSLNLRNRWFIGVNDLNPNILSFGYNLTNKSIDLVYNTDETILESPYSFSTTSETRNTTLTNIPVINKPIQLGDWFIFVDDFNNLVFYYKNTNSDLTNSIHFSGDLESVLLNRKSSLPDITPDVRSFIKIKNFIIQPNPKKPEQLKIFYSLNPKSYYYWSLGWDSVKSSFYSNSTLRNGLMKFLDQGTYYFNGSTYGSNNTTNKTKEYDINIPFNKTLDYPPDLIIPTITRTDVGTNRDEDNNIRYDVYIKKIRKDGFIITIKTWWISSISDLKINWTAIRLIDPDIIDFSSFNTITSKPLNNIVPNNTGRYGQLNLADKGSYSFDGSDYNFNQYSEEDREKIIYIPFNKSLQKTPDLIIPFINRSDIARFDSNYRYDIDGVNINELGFKLKVRTWWKSGISNFYINWIAVNLV